MYLFELVYCCLSRIALVPITKVTLSVAVQQNKELERQQAAIQQVKLCCLLYACGSCYSV